MTTVQPERRTAPEGPPDPDSTGTEPTRRLWHARTLLHPVPASLILAGLLHVLWLMVFANSGGDLAAQDAWAEFAGRHPDSAYNLSWYGGMHPVSYSVISPYLMAVLGVRTTMMLVGTLSAGLLALIVTRCGGVSRPLVPSLWGAFALACNAGSGRVTFGLGLMFGLGAVAVIFAGTPLEVARRRGLRLTAVAVLTALATAGSPVAGLFLMVVAAALFLQRRRAPAYALALPPPVMVALSAWLFPFTGTQPMPVISALVPIACCVAVFVLAPPEWRTVRIGSVIYGLGTLATWVIPSQVGSNVERLALMFGGTVILAAVEHQKRRVRHRSRFLAAVWLVAAGIAGWQISKPVIDIVMTTPNAAWARELAPLVHQLNRVDAEQGRVEVVPVRSHREASALVPYVNLARGWNRQADLDRHALFYDGTLNSATYRAWLERWSVRYVVLPIEDRPDTGALRETKLVSAGQPYLTELWADSNWRLFKVKDPTPLVDPPATAARASEGELVITVRSAGDILVRVPYSPWLGLVDAEGEGVDPPEVLDDEDLDPADPAAQLPEDDGVVGEWSDDGTAYLNRNGCLTESGDWTRLHAPHPGTYRIAAPYQLPRGTPCPD